VADTSVADTSVADTSVAGASVAVASAAADVMVAVESSSLPTSTSSIGYIRTGKLPGLAVTTAARSGALPDLPPLNTFLPGFEASTWLGLGAPRDTSPHIVDLLNNEINHALADPKMKGRLAELAGAALPGSPADFGNLIAAETEKWADVVKFAGIKAG
jgi:tripartite-type tricarboxylate transporter receptor subunit TctC